MKALGVTTAFKPNFYYIVYDFYNLVKPLGASMTFKPNFYYIVYNNDKFIIYVIIYVFVHFTIFACPAASLLHAHNALGTPTSNESHFHFNTHTHTHTHTHIYIYIYIFVCMAQYSHQK